MRVCNIKAALAKKCGVDLHGNGKHHQNQKTSTRQSRNGNSIKPYIPPHRARFFTSSNVSYLA